MGAYENPAANIDTESGKMFANTISSIGQSTVGAMEKIQVRQAAIDKENKENAEKNKAITDRVLDEESKLNSSIYATEGSTNNGIDYHTAFAPQIAEYGKLRTSILKGTSADPQADRKKADLIFASVSVLRSGIEDITSVSEKWKEAYQKSGAGSIDLMGSNPNTLKAFNILENKIPGGSAKYVFAQGDSSRPAYEFKDGEDSFTMELSDLTKALNGGHDAGVTLIPDSATNITDFHKASVASGSDDNVFVHNDKGVYTGKVADMYLYNGVQRTQKTTAGGDYVTTEYKIDKEAILKSESIGAEARRQVAGMTDGNQMVSFYNNYMTKLMDPKSANFAKLSDSLKLEKIALAYNQMPTPEQKVVFENNLKKLLVNTMSDTQISDDPTKFIANRKEEKKEKATKLTSIQVLADNIASPGALDRITGTSSSGSKYTAKQPDGTWILFDKDGISIGKPAKNPSAFSGQLGIK